MKDKRYIIAGGRDFNDYDLLKEICSKIITDKENSEVVCGCAKGADSLGKQFAIENDIEVTEFPANWNLYKKAAGFIRNKQMSDYSTHLIAFWNGKSKGTEHMINLAREKNLIISINKYSQEGSK